MWRQPEVMITRVTLRTLRWSVLLTLLPLAGFGQSRVDSLITAMERAAGATRVDLLNQLAFEYIANDKEKANAYCLEAIQLAEEMNYTVGQGTALIYKGVNEYLSGEFTPSRIDLQQGLKLVAGRDRNMEGYAYLQLGNSFMNQTRLDSSLRYYQLSYEILKDSAHPSTLSKLYKNLGTLYGLHSQADKQVQYLMKSLRIRELLGDKQLETDVLIELGRLSAANFACDTAESYLYRAEAILITNPEDRDNWSDLRQARALCLIDAGRSAEAFALLDSALIYYSKAGLTMKNMTLHMDLAAMFFNRGEYELALKNYYAALRIAETKGYVVQRQDIEVGLGWVNYELGEFNRALELASKSLSDARERNLIIRVGHALTLMGVTMTELRRYEEADRLLQEALAISEKWEPGKVSEAYMNLGYLKEREGKSKEAKEHYRRSYDEAIGRKYRLGMAWSTLGLGTIALKEGRYADASDFLAKAEKLAASIKANQVLVWTYIAHRDLLKEQGLWEESLAYAIRVDALKDSVHRGDLTRRFANLEKMNEIERRDDDIKALEQERLLAQEKIQLQEASLQQQYLWFVGATVVVVLLSIIAVVYARFYLRVKKLNRTIQDNNTSIHLQAQRLTEANIELEKLYRSLTEKNQEIQTQAARLTESHEQLSALNENLQKLVTEKTTDLIRANEELLKQNSELQQFSYSLSHNLRGPVARIMGLAALLQNPSREAEVKNLSNLVLRSSNDLDQVLRDLSKIIDVKNDLHRVKESVDLAQEWNKCVEILRDSIPPNASIIARMENLPDTFTVRAIIHSVFINLLSNSIKYRSPERQLRIILSGQLSDQHLVLRYEDNGLGLDLLKYRDTVFKLFKRFHNHVEGRGMGLYLIKTQIESLNGTIDIDSTVGTGTVFRIILPSVFDGAAKAETITSNIRLQTKVNTN
jgi:signal transduction histidine kinase/Tfp pilus assembly protein PilF